MPKKKQSPPAAAWIQWPARRDGFAIPLTWDAPPMVARGEVAHKYVSLAALQDILTEAAIWGDDRLFINQLLDRLGED